MNPRLEIARESCCRQSENNEVREAIMESGVTHFYDGERMKFLTAKERCIAYGRDLCVYRSVVGIPSDDDYRKGLHWTSQDCELSVKVKSDGQVAIVHDLEASRSDAVPLHVASEHTLNWFKVYWNGSGDYPGSNASNDCAANKCQTTEDGSCLCETTVTEEPVFSSTGAVSKAAIMSQLFIGAYGPPSGSAPIQGEGFTAHIVNGVMDKRTVFEVQHKGKRLFLKNIRSTVGLRSDVEPTMIYEAEDATIVNAVSLLFLPLRVCSCHSQLTNHFLITHHSTRTSQMRTLLHSSNSAMKNRTPNGMLTL